MNHYAEAMRTMRPGQAHLSSCGTYRYMLERRWGDGPPMLWVLLNPSTADAVKPDPTLRRCIGFSAREGYGAVLIVNVYALRSRAPRKLLTVEDPVGPLCDPYIGRAVELSAGPIVLGWGSGVQGRRVLDGPASTRKHRRILLPTPERVAAVLAAINERRGERPVVCLSRTKSGAPGHPLYESALSPLEHWPGIVLEPGLQVSVDGKPPAPGTFLHGATATIQRNP